MIQMSILQPTQQAALGIGVELIHAIELILPTNTSRWNSQKKHSNGWLRNVAPVGN